MSSSSRARLRLLLLTLIALPLGAIAACSDLPAAPLDTEEAGSSDSESGVDGAPGADGALGDGGSDARIDADAGACTFTAPDAGSLAVTTCSAKLGNGVDRAIVAAVAVDPRGDMILAGPLMGTTDFGGGPLTSAGGADVYVAKLDSTCKHVWSKRFGGADDQGAELVAVNGNGEIYLASTFRGTLDFGTGPLTSTEYKLVLTKFDACGTVLWAKKFGVTGSTRIVGMSLDQQSNVVLGGGFYGSVDFGGGALNGVTTSGGGTDIFVAKVDRNGNHVWSKGLTTLGDGGGTGTAASTAFAPDGTIITRGNSGGSGGSTLDFGAGPVSFDKPLGAWITRFTANGVALSTSKFERATTPVASTPSGRLIVVGGILNDVTDLGTGPLVVNGPNGQTTPTAFISEFAADASGATWLKSFGTANPPRQVSFASFAVTETTIGVSGRCAAGVDLGSGTPCSTNSPIFLRYGVDGTYVGAVTHPMGSVAVAPTDQFVVAGSQGDTPGAPEKITVTKFAP